VLAGERGGHAGEELAICTKRKCFETNPCHSLYIKCNDGYATTVTAVHLFSHTYPCLPLAGSESINAGNDVGGSFDVACGCYGCYGR